jgi:hypothetical protein
MFRNSFKLKGLDVDWYWTALVVVVLAALIVAGVYAFTWALDTLEANSTFEQVILALLLVNLPWLLVVIALFPNESHKFWRGMFD